MNRNILILTGLLSLAFPAWPPAQPSDQKEPLHEIEPPRDVPPPLLELQGELDRVETELEALRGKLTRPPGGFHHTPEQEPMGGPWRRHQAAQWLGRNHKVLREMDALRRNRERIVREAWETFDRLRVQGAEGAPTGPKAREELERWTADIFGPRRPAAPPPPGAPTPWDETRWGRWGARIDLLLRRLERMEERIAALEDRLARQQQEINRLRDALRRRPESPSEKTEE